MIEIRTGNIVIDVKDYDLWLIAIALKKYVLNEAKLHHIKHYASNQELDFSRFVMMRESCVLRYIELMFQHLNRPDLYQELVDHLQMINVPLT